jgi:hypothetical protein
MILEEVGWCGLNVHGEGEKPNQQVTLGEPHAGSVPFLSWIRKGVVYFLTYIHACYRRGGVQLY